MLARRIVHHEACAVKSGHSSPRAKTQVVTAVVAVASVATIVGLAVSGILETLPRWAAVLIVVAELLAPAIVFMVLKRGGGQG